MGDYTAFMMQTYNQDKTDFTMADRRTQQASFVKQEENVVVLDDDSPQASQDEGGPTQACVRDVRPLKIDGGGDTDTDNSDNDDYEQYRKAQGLSQRSSCAKSGLDLAFQKKTTVYSDEEDNASQASLNPYLNLDND